MENSEIRQRFAEKNIFGFWDKIFFWFFVRFLYRRKLIALWEANLDKLQMEESHRDLLQYTDTKDRELLMVEKRKPVDQQDVQKIMELEDRITNGKVIRQAYRQNLEFIADLSEYLGMLRSWKSKGFRN